SNWASSTRPKPAKSSPARHARPRKIISSTATPSFNPKTASGNRLSHQPTFLLKAKQRTPRKIEKTPPSKPGKASPIVCIRFAPFSLSHAIVHFFYGVRHAHRLDR